MDLKELRISKKIRQTSLASRLGVKPSTLSGWEAGRSPIPNDKRLEIANILQVDPDLIETPYDIIKSEIQESESKEITSLYKEFKELLESVDGADRYFRDIDLPIDFKYWLENILKSIKRFTNDMIDYDYAYADLIKLRIEVSRRIMIENILNYQLNYYDFRDKSIRNEIIRRTLEGGEEVTEYFSEVTEYFSIVSKEIRSEIQKGRTSIQNITLDISHKPEYGGDDT